MLGQFLEISITTKDIRASIEFYESLGFNQCVTSDVWPHPYGVLTDGRIHLGLHEYRFPSPAVTFVRPDIAKHAADFTALGIELAFAKLTEESFNEIGFRDPAGQMLTLLEARTFFANDRAPQQVSDCGWFAEFSIPATDFDSSKQFWERLGFVALDEVEAAYVYQPLTSDGLSIALHRPRVHDRPMLVFRDSDMATRIGKLRARSIIFSDELPRGLNREANGLIESPEGTPLLLLTEL